MHTHTDTITICFKGDLNLIITALRENNKKRKKDGKSNPSIINVLLKVFNSSMEAQAHFMTSDLGLLCESYGLIIRKKKCAFFCFVN